MEMLSFFLVLSLTIKKIPFLCKRSNESQHNTLIRDQERKGNLISTCKQWDEWHSYLNCSSKYVGQSYP